MGGSACAKAVVSRSHHSLPHCARPPSIVVCSQNADAAGACMLVGATLPPTAVLEVACGLLLDVRL